MASIVGSYVTRRSVVRGQCCTNVIAGALLTSETRETVDYTGTTSLLPFSSLIAIAEVCLRALSTPVKGFL